MEPSTGKVAGIFDDLPHHHAGRHAYSALRAVLMADPHSRRDGLEAETSAEIARRSGRSPRGLFIPHDAIVEARDLTGTTGAGAIATVLPPRMLIDVMRNKMVLRRLGARIQDFGGDAKGSVGVPVKSASSTISWVGDDQAAAAQSNMTIVQAFFGINTATAFTDVTRRMLSLGGKGFQDFVTDDLAKAIAVAVDQVGLNGTGNANQPLGLFQHPNIPAAAFTADSGNGGAPDWATLCGMESTVGQANADAGDTARLGWVTSNQGRSALRRVAELGASGTRPCWRRRDGEETMLGWPAAATSNAPSAITKGSSGATLSALLLGNFDNVLVQLWSAVDILINPYLQSTSGIVRVTAWQDVDVKLLRATSFVAAPAMITT